MNFKKEVRRENIVQLYSQGHSLSEISKILSIGIGTVHRQISDFRREAFEYMKNYTEKSLPEELAKCLINFNSIQEKAWDIFREAKDTKEKIQALMVIQDCSIKKIRLLTNPAVIINAKGFITGRPELSVGPIPTKSISNYPSKGDSRSQEQDAESDDCDTENAVF